MKLWHRLPIAPAAACVLVAGSAALGLLQHRPPALPTQDADDTRFSMTRAVAHLDRIAQRPRHSGSGDAESVRVYLGDELRRLGLAAEDQAATRLTRGGSGRYQFGTSRNVIGRLRGQGSGKAVLLAAHYDTVPSSPGASDNGAGIAALLETARVLRRGPAPRNDVIMLFTDGEENGPSGADIFASGHPWARDVGVVMNFDARGTAGPSLMFETSRENGWLIAQLARGAAHPRASSVYYEIYRRMPNDTDLSAFKQHGMPGFNFAFIELPGRYHTSGDTLAQLDRATLHHHGAQAVSVASTLANADLSAPRAPDVVYFALFDHLFVYSQTWLWALVVVAIVLLAGLLTQAIRTGALSWSAMAWALAANLAALIAACAASYGVSWLATRFVPALSIPGLILYVDTAYGIAIATLCLAVTFAAMALVGRRATRAAMIIGGTIVGGIAVVLFAVYVPGASYLLMWPWLAALVCAILLLRARERGFWLHPATGGDGAGLANLARCGWLAVPAGLLIAPVVWILFAALGTGAAMPVSLLVSLVLALLMPVLLMIAGSSPWRAAGGAAIVSIVALTFGLVMIRPSPSWPQRNNIFYARSLDDGLAVWGTRARTLDAWTARVMGSQARRGTPLACLAESGPFFYRAAPPVLTQAAVGAASAPVATRVTVVRDDTTGAERTVDLRIDAAPGTWWQLSNRSPKTSPAALAEVGGMAVDARHRGDLFRSLTIGAAPSDAVIVRLRTSPAAAELRFTLVDAIDVLPPLPVSPRPDWMVRGIDGRMFNDASSSCQTVSVGGGPAASASR